LLSSFFDKQAITLITQPKDVVGRVDTLPVDQWYEYLKDATLADAILDRLTARANRIELKGKSLRTKQ